MKWMVASLFLLLPIVGCGGEDVGEASAALATAELRCAFDELLCSGTCVDVREDPAHCGRCNVVCPMSASCEGGICVGSSGAGRSGAARVAVVPTRCRSTEAFCRGACIDTESDPLNCGGCDRGCPAEAPVCGRGRCVSLAESSAPAPATPPRRVP